MVGLETLCQSADARVTSIRVSSVRPGPELAYIFPNAIYLCLQNTEVQHCQCDEKTRCQCHGTWPWRHSCTIRPMCSGHQTDAVS